MTDDTRANGAPTPLSEPALETRHAADIPDATLDAILTPGSEPFADMVTTTEALTLYADAGMPRSDRSLQRYCQRGQVRAHKNYDGNGMVFYRIERQSILDHIATLKANPQTMPPRIPRSLSIGAAAVNVPATPRQLASHQTLALVETITRERDTLRDQLAIKDRQIETLSTLNLASNQTIAALSAVIDKIGRFLPVSKRE